MSLLIEALDSVRLGELHAQMFALYQRCFAEPPWSQSDFGDYPDLLTRRLAVPGTSGLIARDANTLAGVVYGWPAPEVLPDNPFYRAITEGTPAEKLVSPALEVVELMVDPDHRGRGIGRALRARFVADQRSAWLCTHPRAPAARLYESAGWVVAGMLRYDGAPRVVYTWDASVSNTGSTGSTARTAVPESSLR
jgi:GNAT superfamily N-acetyltransferase